MNNASEDLIIGKVGAPHGVKGWVKINSYTEQTSGIFDYQPWRLSLGQKEQSYEVEEWRLHSKAIVAKLVGVDDRDQAEAIKNFEISVKAEMLPELAEDEFYWRDLVGMKVLTDKGYDLGVVKELFETGSNDVLLVKANHNDGFGKKERMIPYIFDQVIKSIDQVDKTIMVDWDPGF